MKTAMSSAIATLEPPVLANLDAETVRAHLDEIAASREFAGAPRLTKFLTFVVETALAGDADQIKESLIAVEVYGRRPDYNPHIDSTVRVEAGRLRSRLRQYYEANANHAVQIELPKGTYAPVFHHKPATAVVAERDPAPPKLAQDPVPAKTRFRWLRAVT